MNHHMHLANPEQDGSAYGQTRHEQEGRPWKAEYAGLV